MNAAAWFTCPSPELMIRALPSSASRRKLRLFAAACCRRHWELLTDERSKFALEVVERHADGAASDQSLKEAANTAELAFQSLRLRVLTSVVGHELAGRAVNEAGGLFRVTDDETARRAHDTVDKTPECMAASAVWSATASDGELQRHGYSLADSTIGTAAQAAAAARDAMAEGSKHAALLRDIFGYPFGEVTIDRQWITPFAIDLCRQMYDSRTFDSMSQLADALVAAGCDDAEILDHCRSSEVHVRGCWVVDVVLGKQ